MCTENECSGTCDGACHFALRDEHDRFGCTDIAEDGHCLFCGKLVAQQDWDPSEPSPNEVVIVDEFGFRHIVDA